MEYVEKALTHFDRLYLDLKNNDWSEELCSVLKVMGYDLSEIRYQLEKANENDN